MTTDASATPEYDMTLRYPIDAGGWQVVSLQRDLYPGGPNAIRVFAPGYPVFHAGCRMTRKTNPENGVVTSVLIVSHIGGRLSGPEKHGRIVFPLETIQAIQERLRSYFSEHGDPHYGNRFIEITFVDEDRVVDIF